MSECVHIVADRRMRNACNVGLCVVLTLAAALATISTDSTIPNEPHMPLSTAFDSAQLHVASTRTALHVKDCTQHAAATEVGLHMSTMLYVLSSHSCVCVHQESSFVDISRKSQPSYAVVVISKQKIR
jgi:hypothetical protein